MHKRKVLIACEYSGRVRDAFISAGCDAVSADIRPSERSGPHYQGDVLDILGHGWDMLIGFPPCTYLCCSGNAWRAGRKDKEAEAVDFFRRLYDAPIRHIALENPVGVLSTLVREPDQIIEPYHYGAPYPKATCLWLKNLPHLEPTDIVEPTDKGFIANMSKKDRGKKRSLIPWGIAEAMGNQWGPWRSYQLQMFGGNHACTFA